MIQADLFGGGLPIVQKSPKETPPPPSSRDDLDEAIDTLAQGFLYHIIHRVITAEAADLLRRLKAQPAITKQEMGKPFSELIQKRLVSYESRKPLRIGIHTDRVIAAAAETNRRLDVWIAGEAAAA
jgi:hypothetical protein